MMNKGDGGCDDGLFQDLQIEKTRSDIKVLLAFLDAKYTNNIEDEETRHKKSPPTATFEMLWMLLNPATRVYTDVDGEPAAFVIRSATTNKASRRIGRRLTSISVFSFSGEREVSSLKAFPADMASDKALRPRLEKAVKQYYKGRVVLDPTSYWSYGDTEEAPPPIGDLDDEGSGVDGKWSTYDDIDPRDEMLFPRKIVGFVLKNREWEGLKINHVSRYEPKGNAIKNLVMDDRHPEVSRSPHLQI
ncbi:hypothetical protein HO173_009255 [Letharia columbiana]|uniref:DUF7025 domain-containing protein n=1 Tax=Letharia columbiana TaxID=112416 RepID=A0A8H6FQ21_9LECA|nr:uncharacterized protein HO173_009255 [Letharia columbiana]KAF6232587.1 hypothetical protein HO173_009255 [Letharia columbiana]